MSKKRNEQFTDAELVESQALAAAPPVSDEFHGMGGSYIVDPVTGARTRVEHTRHVPVKIDPVTHERTPIEPEG